MQSKGSTHGIIIAFLYLILTSFPISCGSTMATCTLSLDSSETGPSIDWYQDSNVTLFIDGAYTGQSQEIYERWVWVNDSLGVDSVIFRFKWSDSEEWLNRTGFLVEGDSSSGKYEGNLTWPAPGGGTFQLKIFANNTSGYWSETSPMTVHFGHMYWDPIYTSSFWILFVVLPTTLMICLIGAWKLRRK